ncbi:MAG: Ig-like domain-containing protein, partial [Anaerolineae bacterium]
GVAIAVLTSGTTAGTAVITATADSKYDIAEVVFNPDPPYTVMVTAKPYAIPANGISTSAVRATVTDQYGNLVADGINCYFYTTLGTVWPPSDTTLNGVAETTLTSSEDPGLATVTATCEGKQGTVYVYFYYPLKLYLPVIFKGH